VGILGAFTVWSRTRLGRRGPELRVDYSIHAEVRPRNKSGDDAAEAMSGNYVLVWDLPEPFI